MNILLSKGFKSDSNIFSFQAICLNFENDKGMFE